MNQDTQRDEIEGPWWSSTTDQGRVLADSHTVRDWDIKPLLELRSMLVGPHFGGGAGDPQLESPRNNVYGFYTGILPRVLGGELICMIDTDHASPEEPLALAYERAINSAFQKAEGESMAELAMADMCCGYGGLYVDMGPSDVKLRDSDRENLHHPLGSHAWKNAPVTDAQPQIDAAPHQPRIHYLPPGSWGWDRRAFEMSEAEFYWYDTTFDVKTLIATAKAENTKAREDGKTAPWDLDALRGVRDKISIQDDKHKIGGRTTNRSRVDDQTERERITLTTLFVKEAEIDGEKRPKGHHQVAYTLWRSSASAETVTEMKRPGYVLCPPWGQFVLFYQHMVGEDSTPFSALTANKTKVVANEMMHAVAFRKIREHKRNPVFNSGKKEDITRLEKAKDGEPIGVRGDGTEPLAYHDVQRGGLDQHTMLAIDYFDKQLAVDLAMGGASRAAPDANVSATADTIAMNEGDERAGQFHEAFNRGISRLFRTMGWLIGHEKRFFVRSDFAARAGFHENEIRTKRTEAQTLLDQGVQGDEAEFRASLTDDEARQSAQRLAARSSKGIQGGDFLMVDDFDFGELRFRVNVYQQKYRSPEQRRAESSQMRMEIMQVVQMAEQLPSYDWVSELRQIEEDYGRRGIVASFKADVASARAQVQIQPGSSEARMQPQSAGPKMNGGFQPRMQSVMPKGDQMSAAPAPQPTGQAPI